LVSISNNSEVEEPKKPQNNGFTILHQMHRQCTKTRILAQEMIT